jgi:hypothetical protein
VFDHKTELHLYRANVWAFYNEVAKRSSGKLSGIFSPVEQRSEDSAEVHCSSSKISAACFHAAEAPSCAGGWATGTAFCETL